MVEVIALAIAAACLVGGLMWMRGMNRSMQVGERRVLTIPLNAETESEVTLIVPWQPTESEWHVLVRTLDAMRVGIVVADREPEDEPPPQGRLQAQREHEQALIAESANEPVQNRTPFARRGRR